MKISWFKILVWLSVVFLAIYLWNRDVLEIPKIYHTGDLILSFSLLLVAFIFQGINWHQVLRFGYPVSLSDAIASIGLSVFTKYIPGKVLVIIGRAGYIKEKYGYPYKDLISRSLDAQMLAIFTGVSIGCVSFFWIDGLSEWRLYPAVGILFIGVFLFTRLFHGFTEKTISSLLNKPIEIPSLDFKRSVKSMPSFLAYWVITALAFYFFVNALSESEISPLAGFILPLAITVGIIMLFAPGGIGVREGILAALLHGSGLEIELATTIAVASRIWFLAGEVFLFLAGFYFDRIR